jgi:hypothetical protein
MNLKLEIASIINNNNELAESLKELKFEQNSELEYITSLLNLIKKHGCHPALIIQLILILQLNNDEKLVKQYTLSDLKEIFTSAIASSNDSELLLEFYYFIDRVLDEKISSESRKTIRKKIKSIEKDVFLIKSKN